jgi:hypothetical protein
MPYSYSKFKQEVKEKIIEHVDSKCHVLDVGAGSGCYGEMLKGHFQQIDALEIFEPYVEMFQLKSKYDNVLIGNIMDFDFCEYDLIIMGDVLEHLSVSDAQKIIYDVEHNMQAVLVAVPYMYVQGTEFNNVHETHLQPDLTPEVMASRYPELQLLYGDSNYGYYVNKHFCISCHQQ